MKKQKVRHSFAASRYLIEKNRPTVVLLLLLPFLAVFSVWFLLFYLFRFDLDICMAFGSFAWAVTIIIILIVSLVGAARYRKDKKKASIVLFVLSVLCFILFVASIFFGFLQFRDLFRDRFNADIVVEIHNDIYYIVESNLSTIFSVCAISTILLTVAIFILYLNLYFKLPDRAQWKKEKKDIRFIGDKQLKAEILAASKERDENKLNALLTSLPLRAEQKKRQLEEAKRSNDLASSGLDGESFFDGNLGQYIGWKLLGHFVTAITLGIAYPATLCWIEKWKAKHTVINGHRLSFDGKGIQLLGKWVLWLFLTVITIGIYGLFVPVRIEKWKAKHTHFHGKDNTEGAFDGNTLQYIGYNLLAGLLTGVTLGIAYPVALTIKMRWKLQHTIIENHRLVFSGKGASLLGHWILWIFLSIITLGIFAFFVPIRMEKWKVKNTFLGETVSLQK